MGNSLAGIGGHRRASASVLLHTYVIKGPHSLRLINHLGVNACSDITGVDNLLSTYTVYMVELSVIMKADFRSIEVGTFDVLLLIELSCSMTFFNSIIINHR